MCQPDIRQVDYVKDRGNKRKKEKEEVSFLRARVYQTEKS